MSTPAEVPRFTARSVFSIYLPFALFAILLATAYVHVEHPAYAWEWGSYWILFRELGELATQDFGRFIVITLSSISSWDYNASGLMPLMPVYLLLGGDRTTYIAAVCALYVVPAAIVAAHLAVTPDARESTKRLAIGSAVLVPVFWNAALRGMIDVVGLIPLGFASLLLLKTRFLTRANWRNAAEVGVFIWLTFLIRRWYAFSLVALISLSILAAIILLLHERRAAKPGPSMRLEGETLGRWAIVGFTVLLCLALYQRPLVTRILTTHYGEIYSAYQRVPFDQLATYYREFGPVLLSFLAAGLMIDITQRNWRNLFFFTVAGATVVLFMQVQAPGVQHVLPVAFMAFPCCFSGILFAWRKLSAPWGLAVPLVLLLNFGNSYLPPSAGPLQTVRSALGGPTYPPLHLEHYGEYQRLVRDLMALDANARVAVFASSQDLGDSLLVALDFRLNPRLSIVSQVDLRDGFNWDVLTAEYALIGRPTPLHLPPEGQQVVVIPSESIASGTGIGASYVSTGQRYTLDHGIVAELYRRFRPIPETDISELKKTFRRMYPQWPEENERVPLAQ